ncbi:sugar transferase [Dysgonomonas sp. 25]|uniref:sugar transferase n=1 Tax=Dysgonomonas sp. 25 TaxID=2302933 RepID=UPI0013D53F48|nr:sugar transferase [Dysgonomonas sp. 25]NDV69563.1 sugar transferase [Dysgonomonas sp. 25]
MDKLFNTRILRLIVPIVDLILIYASIILSYLLLRQSLDAFTDNYYAFISISPYIGLAYLVLAHIFELDRAKDFTYFGIAYSTALTIFGLFCVTMALSFLAREFAYPRSVLILSSFIQLLLVSIWHYFTNKMYRRANAKKSVLIIGDDRGRALAYKLIEGDSMWSAIKYICRPTNIKLNKYIDECEVIFLTEDINEERKQQIIKYCVEKNKMTIYEPRNKEILLFNANILQVDDAPLLNVRHLGIQPGNESVKRMMDVFIAFIGAIVFIIPAIILYIFLKIGGGTAFFVQERVTRDGKIFKIYKFRTMIENAEAKSGPMLATQNDKRITRFGHFMRATRLDEIPQIFNILKGDMSIVGPRPERPYFVEQFKKEIPEYDLRHRVKAGLTGLAQIQGKYNTTARDKLKYDLLYINGYSLALDMKLIMQTLNILLRKSSTEGVKEAKQINDEIDKLFREDYK